MQQYPPGAFPYTVQPYDTIESLAQRYHTTAQTIAAVNPGVSYLRVGQVIWICPGYGCFPQPGISRAHACLSNEIRMLWEQHVTWTRLTVISIAAGLPDVDLVANRLLRNPVDFRKVLEPFYGQRIACMFADLLTSHLTIAAELVKAAKAGDSQTAADAERRWYANADEIAAFLASINAHWSQAEWRAMLHEHLALTKSEAVDIITGDHAAGIEVYDAIEIQALKMADVMTEGIVRQFPERFAACY